MHKLFLFFFFFFFFNDTATTEIYTLSLHDALPIFLTGAEPLECTVWALAQHGQPGAGENGLDRLAVRVRQAAQQQHLDLFADQLGHDLIGTRIIEAPDAREIHHRDAARGEVPLDVFANRAAGGPRDEVGVETGDRLLQNGVYHDVLNHFFDGPPGSLSDACSGMMSSTCDPGNAGNPSFSGTSSSQ